MKTKPKSWKKDLGDTELNVLMELHIEELMKKTVPRQNNTFKKDDPSGPNEDGASTANSKKSKTDDNRHKQERSKLSDIEIQYLESVYEHPDLSVTSRGERLGHSAYMNNKIKKELIAQCYLKEFSINLGHSTRGNVKLMELLERGYAVIGKPFPKMLDIQCGPEHWFCQNAGYRWYNKKGFRCELEMNLKGKRADLGITKDGKIIAIEFEMTVKNALHNVTKDIEVGFDRILVAAKNSKVKIAIIKKLNEHLDNEQWEKVKVLLLQDFQFIKEMLNRTKI